MLRGSAVHYVIGRHRALCNRAAPREAKTEHAPIMPFIPIGLICPLLRCFTVIFGTKTEHCSVDIINIRFV